MVSVAHGKPQPADVPIVLTKAVLRTSPEQVEATITTRQPLDQASITGKTGNCALIGVAFVNQNLALQTSPRFRGDADTRLVPRAQLTMRFPNPRTVQMTVPRSALGPRFSATEPWVAYADGPGCPPMNVSTGVLPVITPHPAAG